MTIPGINIPDIFTGNRGKLIDDRGLPIQETQEFEARLNLEHVDVKVVGSAWTGKKLVGISGTGTVKIYQVSTELTNNIADAVAAGTEYVTQFVGEMGNDSGAVARILFENVKFTNQVVLAKFMAQQQTDLDFEFSFVGFRRL